MRRVSSLVPRLPDLFNVRACVEKKGEPGDEAILWLLYSVRYRELILLLDDEKSEQA